MGTQKSNFLYLWFLSTVFAFVGSAGAQSALSVDAHLLTSLDNTIYGRNGAPALPSVPPSLQSKNGNGFNLRNPFSPTLSLVNDVPVRANATGGDTTSSVIGKKEPSNVGADPSSANDNMPTTLTVKTAALLELHGMRQNAVDLCLQLPKKYRTRLHQCADIFRHEIRLQALAKHSQ